MHRIDIFRFDPRGRAGVPADWPEEVRMALRLSDGVGSLVACHVEETEAALRRRLARFEGQSESDYRIAASGDAQLHDPTIDRLLIEDPDLTERAEEFLMNYDFLISEGLDRPAVKVEPLARAQEDWRFIGLSSDERAVVIEDVDLRIAADGSAVLIIEHGLGDVTARDNAVAQTLDGSIIRLDLDEIGDISDRAVPPYRILLPAGTFLLRTSSYLVAGRGTMLYFHRVCTETAIRDVARIKKGWSWRNRFTFLLMLVATLVIATVGIGVVGASLQPVAVGFDAPLDSVARIFTNLREKPYIGE